jgi:hypothetical protein
MKSKALVDLSTQLVKDLGSWTAEMATVKALSPEDLKLLRDVTELVEKATIEEVEIIEAVHK